MDVTWTPKYAKAGWLEPLEGWLGADALDDLAPGAELGNALMATSALPHGGRHGPALLADGPDGGSPSNTS